MKIDFSGAELFLKHLEGEVELGQVLDSLPYQIIFQHAHHYGSQLSYQDVEEAISGETTFFYGLDSLEERLNDIENLMEYIVVNEEEWLVQLEEYYNDFLPKEDISDITIYPVIGYDPGIGFSKTVCMNLNYHRFFTNPGEFFYILVHEVFHVIYEQIHPIPSMSQLLIPADWLSFFKMVAHNEGFAVYMPLAFREEDKFLEDSDYRILSDQKRLIEYIRLFKDTLELLETGPELSIREYSEHVFGVNRLTYRIGCELIRRIEAQFGIDAVRDAVYLSGEEFIDNYIYLLDD